MDVASAQTRIPCVGMLMADKADQALDIFSQALSRDGWVSDKDVIIEFRDGHSDPNRINQLIGELTASPVDVMVPIGPLAVRATYARTRSIPIVAHDLETDPIAADYADGYNYPGRNLTGLFLDTPELATKWIELLKALAACRI